MTILNRIKKRKVSILLFFIVLIPFILITGGNFWEYDSFSSYKLAKNIIDKQILSVDCFWGVQGLHDKCYSRYGLLMSVAIVPLYLIEKIYLEILNGKFFFPGFFPSLTNAIITSFLSLLIYSYLKKLKFSLKLSFIGSLFFAFLTFAPAYTKTLFAEPLITLLIYACFYVLLFFKSTSRKYLFAGLLFGLGFLTKITMMITVPVIFYLFLTNIGEWRKIRFFFFPVLISVILWFSYNYYRFGNLFNSGYSGIGFGENLFEGLYVFIMSPGKSLFIYQPFIVFFIFGLRKFWKKETKAFVPFLILTIIHFAFYAVYSFRTGEWTWGSRFLYTTLPFFVFCVMFFLDNLKNNLVRFIFLIFVVISLVIQFSSVYMSYHRYYSFMAKSMTTNFFHPVFYDPNYSPIVGQWKMIFRLGYHEKEKFAWREAFQEHSQFNENYKIASPDLFFARSRTLIFVLIAGGVIEFYLLKRIYDYL